MYKYYKKNKCDIMYYYFDSITEFLNYIDNNPIANGFKSFADDLGSESTENIEWSGTKTFEEAEYLARYGYSGQFNNFIELKDRLDKYVKLTSTKSKQYNYYVGYAPDVKAYLEGCPLSMLNRVNPIRKQIDVYFNTSYNCETTTSQIFNRGVIILCMVEMLENMGFSVNLNIFNMAIKSDVNPKQIHYAVFRLKNTNERLNIRKLFFPMCHNSWLRRLVLRLMEETPDIVKRWRNGYGTPADEKLIRKVMDLKENDIVIPQPSEIGIIGDNLIKDANAVFDYVNRTKNTDDFELPYIKKQIIR